MNDFSVSLLNELMLNLSVVSDQLDQQSASELLPAAQVRSYVVAADTMKFLHSTLVVAA